MADSQPIDRASAQAQVDDRLSRAMTALERSDIVELDRLISEARSIALSNGLPVVVDAFPAPPDHRSRLDEAVEAFCARNYSAASYLFVELEKVDHDDGVTALYIEQIYFNLAVQELRSKHPADAVFYLGQLVVRNPRDTEAGQLLTFAKSLGTQAVPDSLYATRLGEVSERRHGCE